jgi:hypothetical protein
MGHFLQNCSFIGKVNKNLILDQPNDDGKLTKSKGFSHYTYMIHVGFFPQTKERGKVMGGLLLKFSYFDLESHSTARSQKAPKLINGWWLSSRSTMD